MYILWKRNIIIAEYIKYDYNIAIESLEKLCTEYIKYDYNIVIESLEKPI